MRNTRVFVSLLLLLLCLSFLLSALAEETDPVAKAAGFPANGTALAEEDFLVVETVELPEGEGTAAGTDLPSAEAASEEDFLVIETVEIPDNSQAAQTNSPAAESAEHPDRAAGSAEAISSPSDERVSLSEAPDLTEACSMTFSTKKNASYRKRLIDGNNNTSWARGKKKEGWIVLRSEEPIASLYLCFDLQPETWEIQIASGEIASGEEWVTVWTGPSPYVHVYIPLPSPSRTVRFWCPVTKTRTQIAELRAYGTGSFPAGAQNWLPPTENADILFLATHADDELIFFGGGIPTYAAERKNRVLVAYLANCGKRRTHELLNGLWSMGVRNYPVISPFEDTAQRTMTKEYQKMGGQNKVRNWVVALYRQYRPKVVVTHDARGEYGHVQHRVCAAVAQAAYDAAADPSVDPASAEAFGPWQVRKLYLHLAKENRITMDWNQPLSSLGGITGLEAAVRAFEYHVSQHPYSMNVTKTGSQYDNRIFGLVRTEVGPDEAGGDFLEHIPLSTE